MLWRILTCFIIQSEEENNILDFLEAQSFPGYFLKKAHNEKEKQSCMVKYLWNKNR
jgi:hypothetical protein